MTVPTRRRRIAVVADHVHPVKGIELLLYAADSLNRRGHPVQVAILSEHGGISGNEAWRRTCRDDRERRLEADVRWDAFVDALVGD